MAIDKSLNQAPLGLDGTLSSGAMPGVNLPDDYASDVEDIEVEIVDPDEEEDARKGRDGDDQVHDRRADRVRLEGLEDLAQVLRLGDGLAGVERYEQGHEGRSDPPGHRCARIPHQRGLRHQRLLIQIGARTGDGQAQTWGT